MLRHVFSSALLAALATACADSVGLTGTPLARLDMNASAMGAELVPNEYVVVLKTDGAGVGAEANKIRALGGVVISEWTEGLVGLGIRLPASKLDAVRRNPNVAWVEASQVFHAAAQVPCLNPGIAGGCPWGWDRVSDRILPLNNLKATYPNAGTGVKIYVIDTGINPTHTEFGGRAFSLWDEVGNDPVADDCNGHGSHTASTAAGVNYGFAKTATIYASRVLDCAGTGTTPNVLDGINRVTSDHLPWQNAVATANFTSGYSAAVNAAVAASVADGVVYAVAAGNANLDACLFSPGSEPSANTIGATGVDPGAATPPASPDQEAAYSNHGTCLDGYAPGTNILGAWWNSGSVLVSGTSSASAHFAGIAAVYLGNNPGKTPAQVGAALWSYSTKGVVTTIGAGSPNKLLHNSVPSVAFTP